MGLDGEVERAVHHLEIALRVVLPQRVDEGVSERLEVDRPAGGGAAPGVTPDRIPARTATSAALHHRLPGGERRLGIADDRFGHAPESTARRAEVGRTGPARPPSCATRACPP